MARIQHLAIASLDPFKQAEFYKRVFGFEEVKRLDNPRAKGVVLTDGHINISVLQFHQDQIDQGMDFTGLHHFGVLVDDLEGTAQKCLEAGCVPYQELPEDPEEKENLLSAPSAPTNSKGRRTRSSTSPITRGSAPLRPSRPPRQSHDYTMQSRCPADDRRAPSLRAVEAIIHRGDHARTAKPVELLVRIAGAGLCHSDLSVINGDRPRPIPLALGHEGSGEVVEVGSAIDDVRAGDHVVFQFSPSCGRCRRCLEGTPQVCERARAPKAAGELMAGGSRITSVNGERIGHHGGVSCMAEYTVVDRGTVVVVDKEVPLADAALFGCAVMTGVGAVINTARIRPGDSVAVVGLGGVGLSGVLGARLAGAETIVAIDREPARLESR